MSKPQTFTGWVITHPELGPRPWTMDDTRRNCIIRFERQVSPYQFPNFRYAFDQGWRCKKFTAQVNDKPKTKKP